MASAGKLDDGFEMNGLEPFCYDEARWLRRAAEERERVQRKKEEQEQKKKEKERRAIAHKKVKDSIMELDPKVGRKVYTRFFLRDFSIFDINEKSPIPPMRYADSTSEDEFELQDSVNILSVSIVSSDELFPLNVYGSVIARDSIDYKCIDLFRRDRDDCQPIDTEGGMLVLTGPGRGLVLVDFIYLEIDLKIKQDGVFPDKQFSKGLITIDGRVLSREEDIVVRSETLDSFRSTMEVRFATVLGSVEAFFEIKLLAGIFDGKIIAGILLDFNGNEETFVIHDSRADGVVKSDKSGILVEPCDSRADGVVKGDESRALVEPAYSIFMGFPRLPPAVHIKLRRHVMTVNGPLVFHFENNAHGGKNEGHITVYPGRSDRRHIEIQCGDALIILEHVFSSMDCRP